MTVSAPRRRLAATAALFLSLPMLAATAPTQQTPAPQAPTETTRASAPMLVLTTAQTELVMMVAMGLFEHQQAPPQLEAGSHYVVRVSGDRQVSITTAAGDTGFLELTADPGQLMATYADEIEAVKPMVQAGMMVGLQQQGFEANEVGAFLKEFWGFPSHLHQVKVRVNGDPEQVKKGMDILIDVEPKAGGSLSRYFAAVKPAAAGVPALASQGALVTMQGSLAPESMEVLFAPFMELGLRMTTQDKEQRAVMRATNERFLALYDGTFAMSFTSGMRGSMLVGVRDVEGLQKLLASGDYAALVQNTKLPGQDVEFVFTANAFEHRGVQWMRTKASGMEPNPLMPDGDFVSHIGNVGRFMAMTMGGAADEAKKLIDAVLDDKVESRSLGEGVVMTMNFDIASFFEMVQAQMGGGGGMPDDAPKSLGMQVSKRGHGLRIAMHLQ